MPKLPHTKSFSEDLLGSRLAPIGRPRRNASLTILLTVAFLFVIPLVQAESIDGPANVRRTPKGALLLSLDNHARVDILSIKNGWYRIAIPFYVDTNTFVKRESEGGTFPKGARLESENGSTIGHTSAKFDLGDSSHNGFCVQADEKQQYCVLRAYTAKQNIRSESIIENYLLKRLNSNDRTLQAWTGHIKRFGYEKLYTRGHFLAFILRYNVEEPSPVRRSILYFYDRHLVALYHAEPIPYSHFTGKIEFMDGAVINYIGTVPNKIRKELEEYYVMPMNFSD